MTHSVRVKYTHFRSNELVTNANFTLGKQHNALNATHTLLEQDCLMKNLHIVNRFHLFMTNVSFQQLCRN